MTEWPSTKSTLSNDEKRARRAAFVAEYVPPLVKKGLNRHQIAKKLCVEYDLLIDYMKRLHISCPRASAGGGKGQMGVRPFAGYGSNAQKLKHRINYLKSVGFHY